MHIDIRRIDPFLLPSVFLSCRQDLPDEPAIYFVLAGESVLYIGKAICLRQRWQAHEKMGQLQKMGLVRIAWLDFANGTEEELVELEGSCIKHFKPVLNKRLNTGERERHTIYLPSDLSLWVKIHAIKTKREISELATEALERYRSEVEGH